MFGWHLPAPLAKTVQLVATASSPVALFVIGKLVLHPLAVLAMLALLPPIDPTLRTARCCV